ncbi:hypothetical protein ABLE91_21980 [Aquabacter sp. CN5-332]|uniref:hypothetical protein n=1 Tax=Aquabacter sp. CN5-332 TaxID=3156608 RepID=UPI0032B4D34F
MDMQSTPIASWSQRPPTGPLRTDSIAGISFPSFFGIIAFCDDERSRDGHHSFPHGQAVPTRMRVRKAIMHGVYGIQDASFGYVTVIIAVSRKNFLK